MPVAPASPRGQGLWPVVQRALRADVAFSGGIAALVGLVTALGAYAFRWGIESGMIAKGSQIVLRLVTRLRRCLEGRTTTLAGGIALPQWRSKQDQGHEHD